MFHPDHRRRGDFIDAVKALIPIQRLQPHQIAAAANPKAPAKQLAARRRPSRQTLEREINDHLSAKTR